jgi:UDP-N-acetylmuramate dehydrogenase
VGAAPVQNIGAYGVEVKDIIEAVCAIDSETGAEKLFTNTECQFNYRDSIFKRPESKKYVIVSVIFRLRFGIGKGGSGAPNLSYKDLNMYFAGKTPSQAQVRDAVIAIRTGKFPDLSRIGTAGSFWKNPIISKAHFDNIRALYPLIPWFPIDESRVKIPLAWVLDIICELKGFAIGPVALYEKQPLVLVANPTAAASDIYHLADSVASLVKEKTGILIEREVEYVGC